MVERRELITICRQIGTMMEVGVDFLRLTRALREQTENPRLLELYDQIEGDMRMGENMADAIAKAPDVFSPFAVSLIRQGEARGDIEGAWHRLADFLKQEAQQDKDLGLDTANESATARPAFGAQHAFSAPTFEASVVWKRELRRLAALSIAFLAALTLVWSAAALDLIAARWIAPLQLLLATISLATATTQSAFGPRKSFKAATRCSFCGRNETEAGVLTRSSLAKGAAICASCAATFGHSVSAPGGENSDGETLSEIAKKQSAAQIEMARDFASTFPAHFSDRASRDAPGGVAGGVAPEFEIGEEDDDTDIPRQENRFQL